MFALEIIQVIQTLNTIISQKHITDNQLNSVTQLRVYCNLCLESYRISSLAHSTLAPEQSALSLVH